MQLDKTTLTSKVLQRFWSKVDVRGPNECWVWKGALTKGYGELHLGNGVVAAHRIAYAIANGDPGNLFVCHDCPEGDNRACCNPAHLWIGTDLDNKRDAVRKGQTARGNNSGARRHPERLARGEHHGISKLTGAQIVSIRKRWAGGETQRSISKFFGIDQSTVHAIVHRWTWRHVS